MQSGHVSIVEGGSPFYIKHLVDEVRGHSGHNLTPLYLFLMSSNKLALNRKLDLRTEKMIANNIPRFFDEIMELYLQLKTKEKEIENLNG
jgi:tRNA A37 N6-isopentenylltransferase MiaA